MLGIRKIIHMDMDAFFASVEQLDNPNLLGKPVAVGGRPEGRGVVAAASYEARNYGVRSAMPMAEAIRRCPTLHIVPPRFERYAELSRRIQQIFLEYTSLVEPLSLDEAYLEVTENNGAHPSATSIAQEIQTRILSETGLSASAGVSTNKFVAKIASGVQKPAGLTVVPPGKVVPFLEALAIEQFHGIGKVTAEKMQRLGIKYGRDLVRWTEPALISEFGKLGRFLFHLVRGRDDRPVIPNRERRSVGSETTFSDDLTSIREMGEQLELLVRKVLLRLSEKGACARAVTLKVRYSDFTQVTRRVTHAQPFGSPELLHEVVMRLLMSCLVEAKDGAEIRAVRLLGVSVGSLSESVAERQLRFHWKGTVKEPR